MQVTDTIYGSLDIVEPVLIDLIKSPEIQRLRGVWQHGMPPRYIPSVARTFTRHEHSIGVLLFLRMLGASLEEQMQDPFVVNNMTLLRNSRIPDTDHGVPVKLKFRYVDPLFIEDGHLVRLTSADSAFAREIESERTTLMKPIFVHDVV